MRLSDLSVWINSFCIFFSLMITWNSCLSFPFFKSLPASTRVVALHSGNRDFLRVPARLPVQAQPIPLCKRCYFLSMMRRNLPLSVINNVNWRAYCPLYKNHAFINHFNTNVSYHYCQPMDVLSTEQNHVEYISTLQLESTASVPSGCVMKAVD